MNQVVTNHSSPHYRQLPLVGLLLLFLLLTACLGGGDDPAPEAVAPEVAGQSTGTLVCSNNCINQGQCGTAADGRTVILAHSGQPATRNHDTILNNDSPVFIVGQEQRTVADMAGNQSSLNFIAVQVTSGGPTSWVAGICVNPTTQQ